MLQMYLCSDPVLREIAAPVAEVTGEIRAQLAEMAVMMDDQNGAGLAAPQVGISRRFLVMKDIKNGDPDIANSPTLKMINPKITAKSAESIRLEEGCLSVLGPDGPVFADVIRPRTATVEWTDEHGKPHVREFTGTAARVVQHEIDHLDGILFIDYLSSAKREMVMRKVKKRKV
ncbi:MAG: peptide deformylase [Proteobacteria bacterium]|nr:peptide deformylase [Pseudomonadota bacterium]